MSAHHITVCICTFKRAELLKKLLERLDHQQTDDLFTYSAVVADNDSSRSAQSVVTAFSSAARLRVKYCLEAQRNIALVRNQAIEHADGDFIAFIDDDEFPADDWLCNLFKSYEKYGADGVLGPVKPYFEHDPPRWVTKGKFFERPQYATGYKLSWSETRTGNVLFSRSILAGLDAPFKTEFGAGGEDVDFFRRMVEKGCTFVWCNEAIAYEVVPPARCTRSYLLKRALLIGSNSARSPRHRVRNAATSLVAASSYTLSLPVVALFGQHLLVRYLFKLLYHASRLRALLGLGLVTQREI
jgi:glycosyltransferase involved in cell wall biosynthesis